MDISLPYRSMRTTLHPDLFLRSPESVAPRGAARPARVPDLFNPLAEPRQATFHCGRKMYFAAVLEVHPSLLTGNATRRQVLAQISEQMMKVAK